MGTTSFDSTGGTNKLLCSTRFLLALLAFVGCGVIYSLRWNLSVAIVCMINRTAVDELDRLAAAFAAEHENNSTIDRSAKNITITDDTDCGKFDGDNQTIDDQWLDRRGDLPWNKKQQSDVLSAFFWGYVLTQILSGYLAQRFGAKRVIFVNVLVSVLATLLTPAAAKLHYYALIALRAVMGMAQGSMYPGLLVFWLRWAPPSERSKLTSFTFAGMPIGTMITLPVSGLLCRYGFAGGWPSIFYTFGIAAAIWAVVWLAYSSDGPGSHRFISKNEKEYIHSALATITTDRTDHIRFFAVPWLVILRTPAVWACYAAHFAGDWGAYLFLTCLPIFLHEVLRFDVAKLGLIAAVPYGAAFVGSNVGGILADFLIQRRTMKVVNVRRFMTAVALLSQAVCLIAAGFCRCGQESIVIALLSIGFGLANFQNAGSVVNYMEIAPKYAGLILGVGNTLSCFAGILAPKAMSALTPNHTRQEWLTLFYATAGILLTGAVIYCVYASADVQTWAKEKPWITLTEEDVVGDKSNKKILSKNNDVELDDDRKALYNNGVTS